MNLEVDPSQFPAAYMDIAFADQDPAQRMDIILPSAAGTWPVVVFVHGGGWFFGGRREQCISFVYRLVSQGYAVAAVDYRLVPDAFFPSQIHDIKAAIRYLRAHTEEYRLSTEKIVICGNSAGGHLSALAACRAGSDFLEDLSMGSADCSSRVDGLIGWYGVYDFASYMSQSEQLDPGHPGDNAYTYLLQGDDPGKVYAASPVNYVTEDFPPTLLQQGKVDPVVPWLQTEEFAGKIREVCGPDRVTVDYFPTATHGDPQFKTEANLRRCMEFLDMIYYPDGNLPTRPDTMPEITFLEGKDHKYDPFEK